MQGFLLVLCVVVQTSRPRPTFAADVLLMLEVRTQAFCGRGHFASANKPYTMYSSCALAVARLEICQEIYTTKFSGEKILHTENA